MNPTARILDALAEQKCDPKKNVSGWSARCPAHEDRNPSLSIGEGDDGCCLLDCKAGCDTKDIVGALDLTMRDLYPSTVSAYTDTRQSRRQQNGKPTSKTYRTAPNAVAELDRILAKSKGRRVAQWPYHNANGDPVAFVCRYDLPTPEGEKQNKTFRPVAQHDGKWTIGGMPEPRPLYCLPDLAGADRVYVSEGEKSADAARAIGLTATTSAHGSQSPGKTDWSPLAGKECVILPDQDEPGGKYADSVAAILAKLTPAPLVKVVELPELPNHGDIADWIEARSDAAEPDELRRQVESLADEAATIQISATPREKDRARIECHPIPASQLGDGEDVNWIWHGYIARGFVTLMVGLWKAGKSTLLAHLIREMQAGGDLAGAVHPAKVLVITEEGSGLWARRRDDVGFGDHAYFDIRPFKCRPRPSEWMLYINSVAAAVRQGEHDLVIIDTWAAVNPCPDENDAAGMMAALSPLHEVVEAGAGVLLAHHPRKGDATEGQASRGSGALPGFVDTIIELRRFNAQEAGDRRRKLRAYGRFEETQSELVIEPRDTGYHLVGSTGDAKQSDRQQVIGELLTDAQWRTVDNIVQQWPEGKIPKPSKRTVQLDLNDGCNSGLWNREGKGAKGSPYRYKFDSRTVQPLSTHKESQSSKSSDDLGEL